jgi:hypothetical protein
LFPKRLQPQLAGATKPCEEATAGLNEYPDINSHHTHHQLWLLLAGTSWDRDFFFAVSAYIIRSSTSLPLPSSRRDNLNTVPLEVEAKSNTVPA